MAGSIVQTPGEYFSRLAAVACMVDQAAVSEYAELLYLAWRNRSRVFVFGNGGSAYNASHHVTDYVKTASVSGRRRLHAFSLADNVGLTTAIGNDLSYDEVFRFPLESYAQSGDLAVAISCSGNSANLLNAMEWAGKNGLKIVAMTGFAGGKAGSLAHLHINVPSDNYGIIEDIHLSIGHIAAQMLLHRVSAESTKS